jgi:hypothetical protein
MALWPFCCRLLALLTLIYLFWWNGFGQDGLNSVKATETRTNTIHSKVSDHQSFSFSFQEGIQNGTLSSYPLIFVYPAPQGLLGNSTASDYRRDYFKLEHELLQGLRRRGRVTKDPSVATHFWVEHAMTYHWIDTISHEESILHYYLNHLRPHLSHILHDLPYFNASQGRDHIFVYTMDNGPICEQDHGSEIFTNDSLFQATVWKMRKVGYYGKRRWKIPESIVRPDKGLSSFAPTQCWDDSQDIAVPQWHDWDMKQNNSLVRAVQSCYVASDSDSKQEERCHGWWRYLHGRALNASRPFFFRGRIVSGHECSHGIRPWLRQYCASRPNLCHFNNQTANMTDGVLALSPAGWACWSSRLYDALHQIVVPVLLADNMVLPFERYLDYDSILFRVSTGEPTSLSSDGGRQFQDLVDLAAAWMRTCRNDGNALEQDGCIRHPVSLKLASITLSRKWHGWQDVSENENAFALFERELMQRI